MPEEKGEMVDLGMLTKDDVVRMFPDYPQQLIDALPDYPVHTAIWAGGKYGSQE